MKLRFTDYKVITKNPLFKGLDEETAERAVNLLSGKIKNYEKGAWAQEDGKPFKYFGIVLSGNIQVCSENLSGEKLILATVSQGETFGESLAYLQAKESPVSIRVIQKSTILWLSTEAFYNQITDPILLKLLRTFTSMMAMRPLEMNKRIQILSKVKIRDRILLYLSSCKTSTSKNEIEIPLNREDMAAYIGANRSALSRELSLMKEEGILDYKKNHFYILKKKK